MANLIDVDAVNKWLLYENQSGIFYWKKSPMYKVKAGDKAGALLRNGCGNNYLTITVHGKRYLAHRIVATLFLGANPSDFVDHINGNGLDNRVENLEWCTQEENQIHAYRNNLQIPNNGVKFSNNTSGYVGVTKCGKKWKAQIRHNNTLIYLGVYDDKEKAYEIYMEKLKEIKL